MTKSINKSEINAETKPAECISIKLQYLTAEQATNLIKMFDSAEAYAENFSAIKAITRGLFNIILETKPAKGSHIGRLFDTVNRMQSTLMLDDMQEVGRILNQSGLMPDTWHGFRSQKGGGSCA